MFRALAVLLSLAGAPAAAEQFSLNVAPRTEGEAIALTLGIAALSLRSHVRSGGEAEDWGRANARRLLDPGSANWAAVRQRGSGHRAELTQRGRGNAHAILQFGEGARASVVQSGDEQGVTIQFGR